MLRARPLVTEHGVIPAEESVKPGFALDLERKIKSNVMFDVPVERLPFVKHHAKYFMYIISNPYNSHSR